MADSPLAVTDVPGFAAMLGAVPMDVLPGEVVRARHVQARWRRRCHLWLTLWVVACSS